MELSYFLAQLMGLMLVIYGIVLLHRPAIVTRVINQISSRIDFALLASVMGIVPGLAIILSHNVWVRGWPVIITLFGWAALIKGVAFLVTPQSLVGIGQKFFSSPGKIRAVSFIMMLFGLYLTGAGFKIF